MNSSPYHDTEIAHKIAHITYNSKSMILNDLPVSPGTVLSSPWVVAGGDSPVIPPPPPVSMEGRLHQGVLSARWSPRQDWAWYVPFSKEICAYTFHDQIYKVVKKTR